MSQKSGLERAGVHDKRRKDLKFQERAGLGKGSKKGWNLKGI
jgi:hypothetical protein